MSYRSEKNGMSVLVIQVTINTGHYQYRSLLMSLLPSPVIVRFECMNRHTVVPALGDPRRERPPAVYGRVINVPTHFNVKLPVIGGHLPNADSHLLVVRTCYNGQCKQKQRFRRSFQPKLAGSHPNLRSTARSIYSVLPSGDNKQYFLSRV